MEPVAPPLFYDTGSEPAAFPNAPTVGNIAAFLSARLGALTQNGDGEGADDVPLVWPSHTARWDEPVRRLVLGLDWSSGLEAAIVKSRSRTALFLHRPFELSPGDAPGLVAVFASHTGFDAHLTTAYNPPLARALGMTPAEPVRDGSKNDAIIGMIGDVADAPTGDELARRVQAVFGGADALELSEARRAATVERVAVMSALRSNLVALVAEAGATLYVTGQLREVVHSALRERDMGVVAVGHRRSELWGLGQLGRELGAAFPGLDILVYDAQ